MAEGPGRVSSLLSTLDCWLWSVLDYLRQLLLHVLDFLYFFSFCFLVPGVRTLV